MPIAINLEPNESIQQSELSTAEDRGYNFSTVRIVNNFLEKVDNCEMDETPERKDEGGSSFFSVPKLIWI